MVDTIQNSPDIEVDLIMLCQKLSENFHGMLLSDDHAASVILRSMIATMAVLKGNAEDAESLLNDAMTAFEAWEHRRLRLWNDAVEVDQEMLNIMAKRSNVQDEDLEIYKKRLEKLKSKIEAGSGGSNGGR